MAYPTPANVLNECRSDVNASMSRKTAHVATRRNIADGPGNLLAICWRQWRSERALRKRGIDFRTTDLKAAQAAYAAMTAEQFTAINGRQAWANRRTISRSLAGLLPNHPLQALDLGCGIGESTRVLAALLPPGSSILGIEFAASLVAIAECHTSKSSQLRFVAGSITETLHSAAAQPIASGSIDL